MEKVGVLKVAIVKDSKIIITLETCYEIFLLRLTIKKNFEKEKTFITSFKNLKKWDINKRRLKQLVSRRSVKLVK